MEAEEVKKQLRREMDERRRFLSGVECLCRERDERGERVLGGV